MGIFSKKIGAYNEAKRQEQMQQEEERVPTLLETLETITEDDYLGPFETVEEFWEAMNAGD